MSEKQATYEAGPGTEALEGEPVTVRIPAGTGVVLFNPAGVPPDQVDKVAQQIQWAYTCRDVKRMYERLRPKLGWKGAYERVAEKLPVSERQARRIVSGG